MTLLTAMSIGVLCRKGRVYAEDNGLTFSIKEAATSDADDLPSKDG